MKRYAATRVAALTALFALVCVMTAPATILGQEAAPVQASAQIAPAEAQASPASVDNGNGNDNGPARTPDRNLFDTARKGGPVMIFIVLLGIVGLTIIIERLIYFTRNRIWFSDQVENYLADVSASSQALFREEKEDELRAAFQVYSNHLERGMAFLSGIGNLAPILGFLGTVTGMITAFAAIAAATTVNARIVAVGIQEALITTAGGLIVSAPITFFYYLFTHVIHQRFSQSEEIIGRMCGTLPRLTSELDDRDFTEGL